MYERLSSIDDIGEKVKVERQLKTIERVRYAAVLNPNLVIEFINPSDSLAEPENCNFVLNLNESQQQAVKVALGSSVLSLIQGPPGTGKTQVIAEICLQLFRQNPNVRILVCSETHIAVNNLISRISEYDDSIRIVRIRDKEQNGAVDKFSPEAIVNTYNEWLLENCKNKDIVDIVSETLSNYKDDKSLEKVLALSASIVGMTCNRVSSYVFESSSEMFDVVIIDEVCKATLPEILMPLTIAQKAVLVGDPKQLPPVFCSEEIDVIRNIEKCDLQKYMYIDELFLQSKKVTVLDTQFRMTNQIGGLIGKLFYEGRLKNGRNVDIADGILWVDYAPTQIWPEESNDEKQRIFNLDECKIISKVLKNLDNSSSYGTTVAIIAPYKDQVYKLRTLINKESLNNLEINIDTVDGFQGKESDVVIFSLTRTVGSFRFLADVRRLNVALSRARDKIYIIGKLNYASNNQVLKSIAESSSICFYQSK